MTQDGIDRMLIAHEDFLRMKTSRPSARRAKMPISSLLTFLHHVEQTGNVLRERHFDVGEDGFELADVHRVEL